MLRVRLDLFVIGATPLGIIAVFVQVELDCLNDPTVRPIPDGFTEVGVRPNTCKSVR